MGFKFAHLADVHLGAFRDSALRELNLEAFKQAIDACIRERADFVVVSGDLFHITLPDMSVVDKAVKKMREARDAGLRIYLVYGSHDYSPTETNVIDVLASAGVLAKVHASEGNAPKLEFVKDESGAVITGVCARKRGLERKWFKELDASAVLAQKGFKIFVFHSAVEEFKPTALKELQAIPVEWLPKGFDYYAGGHVHSRSENSLNGKKIVFPGALFAADFRDLEDASKNPHGFYFVEATAGGQASVRFQPIELCGVELINFDANGKNAFAASEELLKAAEGVDASGKIVLLRARGELASGKPSEIDFNKIKEVLASARVLVINRAGLSAREELVARVAGASRAEVEEKVFSKALAGFETKNVFLKTRGTELARELLKALSKEKPEGSTKSDYEAIFVKEATRILEASEEK